MASIKLWNYNDEHINIYIQDNSVRDKFIDYQGYIIPNEKSEITLLIENNDVVIESNIYIPAVKVLKLKKEIEKVLDENYTMNFNDTIISWEIDDIKIFEKDIMIIMSYSLMVMIMYINIMNRVTKVQDNANPIIYHTRHNSKYKKTKVFAYETLILQGYDTLQITILLMALVLFYKNTRILSLSLELQALVNSVMNWLLSPRFVMSFYGTIIYNSTLGILLSQSNHVEVRYRSVAFLYVILSATINLFIYLLIYKFQWLMYIPLINIICFPYYITIYTMTLSRSVLLCFIILIELLCCVLYIKKRNN